MCSVSRKYYVLGHKARYSIQLIKYSCDGLRFSPSITSAIITTYSTVNNNGPVLLRSCWVQCYFIDTAYWYLITPEIRKRTVWILLKLKIFNHFWIIISIQWISLLRCVHAHIIYVMIHLKRRCLKGDFSDMQSLMKCALGGGGRTFAN